jgi:putative transposase
LRDNALADGPEGTVTSDRAKHRGRGIWQQRFYDHAIRDESDFQNHMDYLHYNPVKHGFADCPHAYPYSTFTKWVNFRAYAQDWCCSCGGSPIHPPGFSWADDRTIE